MPKKNIISKGVSLLPDKFDLSTMTTQKPLANKAQILKYLKSVEPFTATTYPYEDPVDGTILTYENASFADKGFIWSNVAVMLFEKYDVKLNDDFIKMFA